MIVFHGESTVRSDVKKNPRKNSSSQMPGTIASVTRIQAGETPRHSSRRFFTAAIWSARKVVMPSHWLNRNNSCAAGQSARPRSAAATKLAKCALLKPAPLENCTRLNRLINHGMPLNTSAVTSAATDSRCCSETSGIWLSAPARTK